ncbi:MAG TPA: sucrose-phosphate phosphatase [Candidatus Obscuribacterales bacterium]
MSPFLFITDLDGTLVGDPVALARLNHCLARHRDRYGTILVYSTGRSPTRYDQLTREVALLEPDVRVLAVGTEIYTGKSSTPDPAWVEHLNQGWERHQVAAIAARYPELTPQPASEQLLYKLSYCVEPEEGDRLLPLLQSAFQQAGLAVQVVYSSGVDLDLLPRHGNKGAAVQFLQQMFQMPPERTVVCGDSGNDLAMYEHAEAKGIIVGNAKPELITWHHHHPSSDRFLADRPCAGGILQGLHHFGFLDPTLND